MYNKLKQKNIAIEEVLKVAFEKNAAPTAIYNLDTSIAMVNDAYCETSGYTREEVIGMSWLKLLPPGEFERRKEYNAQRLANPETAPNKYDFAFYTKNGELRYGFASIATILNLAFNSIRIAHARLRKKLQLAPEENLTAYLMTFK